MEPDRSPFQGFYMRTNLDHPLFVQSTWVVLAILLAAAGYLFMQERWLGVAVLGGTILASLAFIVLDERLPRAFNLLFVLAGALNAGAYVFDLWDRIGVYDEFVHAYTTFALAAAFGCLALNRTFLSRPTVSGGSSPPSRRSASASAFFGRDSSG